MRQSRGCLDIGRTHLRRLFRQFCALDYVFDDFLLLFPLLVITPPHWPFVFAFEPEMFASFALSFAFVTLLSPKATSKAT